MTDATISAQECIKDCVNVTYTKYETYRVDLRDLRRLAALTLRGLQHEQLRAQSDHP